MQDTDVMRKILDLASQALDEGHYPIAAAVKIGDDLFLGHNTNNKHESWVHHAENSLLIEHGGRIKAARKKGVPVELFTTLEPCIMCLGTAVVSRITRVVYACPDPHGGAARLEYNAVSDGYEHMWPTIEGGLFKEESYGLMYSFMLANDDNWKRIREKFEAMRAGW